MHISNWNSIEIDRGKWNNEKWKFWDEFWHRRRSIEGRSLDGKLIKQKINLIKNCSDKLAENDEILAEKLASSNETEIAENADNLDGNKTKLMNELPTDGMAADLDTLAGTEMPAEIMNGTSMGMVEDDEEKAFNLTNSPNANDENNGQTSMSPKQQQVY